MPAHVQTHDVFSNATWLYNAMWLKMPVIMGVLPLNMKIFICLILLGVNRIMSSPGIM